MDHVDAVEMIEVAETRPVVTLIAKYAESHRNPINEIIHFICVPAIMLAVLGLLWSVRPLGALVMVVLCLNYYMRLSRPLAVGMLLMLCGMLLLFYSMRPSDILPASIAIFVVAWIGQFIGHIIEGKKPSFFEDMRFLLIGPLFVLGFLYRRLHIAY